MERVNNRRDLAQRMSDLETQIMEAARRGQEDVAELLSDERRLVRQELERQVELEQQRKEGARSKQCTHGISMADDCRACRENLTRQQQLEAVQAARYWYERERKLRSELFTGAEQEAGRLEWTPIAEDPQKGMTYGAIDRSATLAEYWNQTKPKPGELSDALDRPGTFGSMFDAVKVRRLQEDAAAAQAKQMVNQRMARYVAIQQDLEMQLGAVMQGQSQPRVQVRRAPATVAPGPPMEAKRGYFDE